MPTDYRRYNTYKNKISREFTEPVRIVDDIVDWTNEIRTQGTALNSSTATQITFPEDCEIFLLRHVDATDVVWFGPTNTVTAGATNAWPLRPEDPPLRVRVSAETEVWAITGSGNVDLHIMGLVRR